MTTYLGKSCSFGFPRVPFVKRSQFMYLVISLLVLRAGCGVWLYQFLIIAYRFTMKLACFPLFPFIVETYPIYMHFYFLLYNINNLYMKFMNEFNKYMKEWLRSGTALWAWRSSRKEKPASLAFHVFSFQMAVKSHSTPTVHLVSLRTRCFGYFRKTDSPSHNFLW